MNMYEQIVQWTGGLIVGLIVGLAFFYLGSGIWWALFIGIISFLLILWAGYSALENSRQ